MSATNTECPICMDTFVGIVNKVVTECGHAFHCSCLMQNVAHNGFGCPYCREKMAEEPEEEEPEEEDTISWHDIDTLFDDEEITVFEEEALTSFRMFHQRINGEEVEEEEDQDDWATIVDEEENQEEVEVQQLPSSSFLAEKLTEKGITYEDLVKSLLNCEHDYPDFRMRNAEIYGQFKIIISRYGRQNQERLRTNPIEEVKQVIVDLPAIAEAKPSRVDLD